MIGPQGPIGPEGPQGPQGETGPVAELPVSDKLIRSSMFETRAISCFPCLQQLGKGAKNLFLFLYRVPVRKRGITTYV